MLVIAAAHRPGRLLAPHKIGTPTIRAEGGEMQLADWSTLRAAALRDGMGVFLL
jgi:hypothetical protein